MGEANRWELYAHKRESGYWHAGSKKFVEAHMLHDPIVQIELTEDPEGTYWGWLAKDATYPSMVWPKKMLLDICFPYGPDVEQERGKGRVVRMVVKEI